MSMSMSMSMDHVSTKQEKFANLNSALDNLREVRATRDKIKNNLYCYSHNMLEAAEEEVEMHKDNVVTLSIEFVEEANR